MLSSKTVFILGAGASAEAKLPIGSELTAKISKLLDLHIEYHGALPSRGDDQIYRVLNRMVQTEAAWGSNNLIASGRELAEAMDLAPSIDTFLQTHAENREFVQLGKLGIVKAISDAERSSLLRPGEPGTVASLKGLSSTWYTSLARLLFSEVPATDPEAAFEDVSFIIFNYDRCLEVYLRRAVEVFFRTSAVRADGVVRGINIVHPYGSLGSIWPGDPTFVPYASDEFDLLDASRRIQTFSESIAEGDVSMRMAEQLESADSVVFLGFGFHNQNMDLIRSAVAARKSRPLRVFATTMGMSQSDADIVCGEISDLFSGPMASETRILTHDGTCAGPVCRLLAKLECCSHLVAIRHISPIAL